MALSTAERMQESILVASEATRQYRTCPNCGFRLMEVWPPTRGTYPFSVEYCPICGRRRDEHGTFPGRALSDEARLDALRQWLKARRLNERILREHYHLSLERFFEK